MKTTKNEEIYDTRESNGISKRCFLSSIKHGSLKSVLSSFDGLNKYIQMGLLVYRSHVVEAEYVFKQFLAKGLCVTDFSSFLTNYAQSFCKKNYSKIPRVFYVSQVRRVSRIHFYTFCM